MKRIIIFPYLLLGHFSYSQISHSISLGPDLALPSKNFGAIKTGIGGSIDYQVKFQGPIGAQLHIGYNHFKNKVVSNDFVNFLLVRAGIVGFIYQDIIFVAADAGISHYSASTVTKQTGFSFGIGPGYKLFFNPEKKQFVQLSAYFNLHKFKSPATGSYNYTWFNIRLAYGFSFSKKHIVR